jgi:hypothetical protein
MSRATNASPSSRPPSFRKRLPRASGKPSPSTRASSTAKPATSESQAGSSRPRPNPNRFRSPRCRSNPSNLTTRLARPLTLANSSARGRNLTASPRPDRATGSSAPSACCHWFAEIIDQPPACPCLTVASWPTKRPSGMRWVVSDQCQGEVAAVAVVGS